jgi:hypothetical protein
MTRNATSFAPILVGEVSTLSECPRQKARRIAGKSDRGRLR